MPRTNLSLGNLYRAVSGSARTSQAVSIRGLNGGGTNISMSAFATDAITVTVPTFTYIVESTTENAQFSFSLTGSNFYNKVQQQFNNYTCSFNNSNFTTGSKSVASGPTVFPITAAAIGGAGPYSEASASLTMSYADGYNLNATNYGVVTTKVLYAVDVYNTINQPDFCLLFGTKVQLSDGTELNVEDLMVGDEIKAWVPDGLPDENLDGTDTDQTEWRFFLKDELSGTTKNVRVADVTFNFASTYYSINSDLLKATGLHPIYVWDSGTEKYKFKNIEDITIGDKLINDNQIEIEVTSIDKINSDVEIVTINVEESDVYLSNGFISHNKGTTTQPYIPARGLRMYLEPAKSGSWAANAFPANGIITVDLMDMAGYNTGVRPGAQIPLSLANSSPSYVSSSLRKERCLKFDGTDLLYKDTASISGGIANFNTNSGSIHVWVRPNSTMGGVASRPLFDYRGSYVLLVSSSNSSLVNRVGVSGSLGNFSAATTMNSGTWYMVSTTFISGGTTNVFVDGTSVGSFTANSFANPTTANFLTIGSNTARTLFWSGSIGPVLFYNYSQSAASVQQVYDYFSPTYKV